MRSELVTKYKSLFLPLERILSNIPLDTHKDFIRHLQPSQEIIDAYDLDAAAQSPYHGCLEQLWQMSLHRVPDVVQWCSASHHPELKPATDSQVIEVFDCEFNEFMKLMNSGEQSESHYYIELLNDLSLRKNF